MTLCCKASTVFCCIFRQALTCFRNIPPSSKLPKPRRHLRKQSIRRSMRLSRGEKRYKGCACPSSKRTTWLWQYGRSAKSLRSTRNLLSLMYMWKERREVFILFFATTFIRLVLKHWGMRFGTHRRGGSRLRSAMTRSNSDCVCATMEKVLIQRFSRVEGVRDTMGCQACRNSPRLLEVSSRGGGNSSQGRK